MTSSSQRDVVTESNRTLYHVVLAHQELNGGGGGGRGDAGLTTGQKWLHLQERKVKPGRENWQVYTSLEVNPPFTTSLCTALLTVPGQQNQGMS